MRPVLLEMTGFGSFREPATVDFTDADFFVLVGPTGAGKSTVIDAMTFALYGSVPRWDDRRTVALALAPTVSRGLVRLVFDVGPHRYIAARELRRTSIGVGMRNGRLERLIDPTQLGTTDDETELIAADSKVSGAVEQLLGLSFDHFCSCVVLPQGDFAEFLHARPADRQKIITNLLGIGVYETIRQDANAQAAAAQQRASVLDEMIAELAGITEDTETEANQRVRQLTMVSSQVAIMLPKIAAATAEVENAEHKVRRIDEERARLSALAAPTDITALSEQLTAALTALHQADRNLAQAETSDDEARSALEAAPARGPLEQTRHRHAERARLAQGLPDAESNRAEAANLLATIVVEHESATRELTAARDRFEAASTTTAAAKSRVATLRAERARLAELSAPAGISDMCDRERSSQETFAMASRHLAEAEVAEAKARRVLEAAPPRTRLERAKANHIELARVLASEPILTRRVDDAQQQLTTAQAALDDATRTVELARTARDEAARTDAAAALRPHLVAGQPCPVCEHPVEAMPEPLDHELLAAADKALSNAEKHLRLVTRQHTSAAGAEQQALHALENAAESIAELRQALTDELADAKAVDAELTRLDELDATLRETSVRLHRARADHDAASTEAAVLKTKLTTARTSLNAARDPLVPLGAPPVDELDLADAWNSLTAWAVTEASTRDMLLEEAGAEASKAESATASSADSLARTQGEAQRTEAAKLSAARSDQDTATVLRQLHDRLAELASALADAPNDGEAAAELARIDRLEAAAKAAHETLRSTRTARESAVTALAELHAQEQTAWNVLRTTRDLLVALEAPPIQREDLRTAWSELVGWADQETRTRETMLTTARGSLAAAEQHRGETERALSESLTHAGVVLPEGQPTAEAVSVAVTTDLERARSHVRSIQAQRKRLAELLSSKVEAEAEKDVAHMLAGLLRSNEFPRWLISSALDVLVQDASVSLSELSGGQFDLSHDDGEFVVIDHTNADLPRPVKTLSGGETFQASLALALALSAQMATLAAAGAARLDSIFLDEGFGTLDETTLDTVANTLENLASQGDRMVGVVSHVSSLADRIPVKFRVSRDQYGSTIRRDDS